MYRADKKILKIHKNNNNFLKTKQTNKKNKTSKKNPPTTKNHSGARIHKS